MAAVIMFVLVLLFSILFRQDRKLFERYIAHGLKWIWIEIKVIAVFVWAFVVLNIISYGFDLTGTAVTLFSLCSICLASIFLTTGGFIGTTSFIPF